jgi:type III pantothenate kinase
MLLAIDVGNTNIALGVYQEGRWTNHWRIRTVHDQMPDEHAVLLRSLFRDDGLRLEDVDRVVLSSVVPALTTTLSEMFEQQTKGDLLVVGPGVRTGLRIRTDNPAEVGGDLVANAVAAHALYGGTSAAGQSPGSAGQSPGGNNCIVVDFGTALTFTAVDRSGDLLGVAIAPGLRSAAAALASNTAQLPHVQLVPPPAAIGRNTVHSIQSGVVFGYIGLVSALIERMRAELGGQALAIATGGLARVIAPLTDQFAAIEPWLTLDGLRIIADRNI